MVYQVDLNVIVKLHQSVCSLIHLVSNSTSNLRVSYQPTLYTFHNSFTTSNLRGASQLHTSM